MREGELSAGKRLVLFFKLWTGGQAKGSEGPAQFLLASSDQPKLERALQLAYISGAGVLPTQRIPWRQCAESPGNQEGYGASDTLLYLAAGRNIGPASS